MSSEREEMKEAEEQAAAKVNAVRAEVQRQVETARSMYFVAVMPNGEMVNLCFFQGYSDMRAMQIEAGERIRQIIAANSKALPSQAL